MAEHSIFANNPYPGTLALFSDAPPNILVANGFYTFTAGANGWQCVGGRLYVPASVTLEDPVPVGMWPYAGAGNGPDLSLAPVRSATIAAPVTGWNEVRWAPIEVVPGVPFWIGCDLGEGRYLAATDLQADFIQASDGATLVLGEQNMAGLGARAYFRIGTEGTTAGGGNGYGIDVLVDDGTTPVVPEGGIAVTLATAITVDGSVPTPSVPEGGVGVSLVTAITVDGSSPAPAIPEGEVTVTLQTRILLAGSNVELPSLPGVLTAQVSSAEGTLRVDTEEA